MVKSNGKFPKGQVDYGPGHNDGDHCGICRHFEPPNACEIVRGLIRSADWCREFASSRVGSRYR